MNFSLTRTTCGCSLAGIVAVIALVAFPAHAAAAEREIRPAGGNPSGQLQISPGRLEFDATPGERQTFDIELTNDSDGPFDVSLSTTDVGQTSDPRSVADAVEGGEFGAGDWLVPELTDFRLAANEHIKFKLYVDPPADAPVGTNLAGLVIDSTVGEGAVGTADSDSSFRIQGLIQVFPTIAGAVDHDLRIRDIDVRDSFILGSQRFAVWDVTFENRGTINEHANGTIQVNSLFGNSAYRVPIKDFIILRGAKRTQRVIWKEVPWVGAFTPEARVRGDNAKLIAAKGERVIVLPWWLPVLILTLLVLPALGLWWRRRREWKLYLDDEGYEGTDEWADDDGALSR